MDTSLKYNSHYDAALDYNITMYDQLPYKRDSDRCNGSNVTLCSGHIIKYYMCNTASDYYLVDNKDAQIQQILHSIYLQEQKRREEALEQTIEDSDILPEEGADDSSVITEEQIQGLVTEQEPEISSPKTENLDEIEDW